MILLLGFLIHCLFFVALDFPKHMKEKNTQALSKSLTFSYLFAFHSAFSGFNPWVGREELCAEHWQE